MKASRGIRRPVGRLSWLWVLGLCGIASTATAAERAAGWQPGFTLAPYGWLAGLDGTLGSKSDDLDGGGGIGFPPRADVSVSDELEEIGFMFYGEWRGERWTAFFDSVWANVSQNADLKLDRLLPASDTKATFDGNIYQVGIGYRLFDWERSFLTVYGGGRYYDIEAKIEIKGGILPGKIDSSTTRSWTDAVFGGRWSYDFGKHWNAFLLADYGFGESRSVWQAFGTLGYEFSWGSIRGGYRYMSLDYDTATYKVDLSLRGPVLGAAFTF